MMLHGISTQGGPLKLICRIPNRTSRPGVVKHIAWESIARGLVVNSMQEKELRQMEAPIPAPAYPAWSISEWRDKIPCLSHRDEVTAYGANVRILAKEYHASSIRKSCTQSDCLLSLA